jgi:hypothetical protein
MTVVYDVRATHAVRSTCMSVAGTLLTCLYTSQPMWKQPKISSDYLKIEMLTSKLKYCWWNHLSIIPVPVFSFHTIYKFMLFCIIFFLLYPSISLLSATISFTNNDHLLAPPQYFDCDFEVLDTTCIYTFKLTTYTDVLFAYYMLCSAQQ